MSRMFSIARRILSQFRHDPRTVALMIVAPCLVLWLFSALLGSDVYEPRLATVGLPSEFQTVLENQEVQISDVNATTAARLLAENEVDAIITLDDTTLDVQVEGADASKTRASLAQIQAALVELQKDDAAQTRENLSAISFDIPAETLAILPAELRTTLSDVQTSISEFSESTPIESIDVSYLHGSEDWTNFDFFGPVFIGIFIFVFVFLTSSMSLLTERSGGTMERFLMTPVKPWQVVGGYIIGFGVVTLIQSVIILWACISLIGFPNEGPLPLVALITVSMAIVSLTLGLLISGLARTPFQVIQLMILFVVPQILLSGIFDLSQTPNWMQAIAACFPIYYGADALRDVMLRGAGFSDIAVNFSVLWGFIVALFTLSCLNFRKKRAKLSQR